MTLPGHYGARRATRWGRRFPAGASHLLELSGGVYWDHLWLGREYPRLGPLSLAASGGAIVDLPPEDLRPGPLVDAMWGFGDASSAMVASLVSDSVGLIESWFAFFVVLRTLTSSPPAANRHVLGRRAASDPFAGHELVVRSVDGRPFWRVDPGVPPVVDLVVAHDVADADWHVVVGRVTPSGAVLATEVAQASAASVGLVAAAPSVAFSVGRGRISSLGCHVAAVGVTRSDTVDLLDCLEFAQAVYAEVADVGAEALAGELFYFTTGDLVETIGGEPYVAEGL